MHMADALLSPAVGGSFWAASVAAISWSARRLRRSIDDKLIPLMGVLSAFVFAAQMINFTIPGTGSSGHLGGGMLLAIILGPSAAFLAIASVLTVQAFFFADGGLLALGCNIWNLGVYPCFVAYPLIYRPLTQTGGRAVRIGLASVISAVVGLQLGAFSVVLQTVLSGQSDLPFRSFLLVMQPIHLAIGMIEGIVTAGVVNYVRASRPEILEIAASAQPLANSMTTRRVLITLGMLTLLTGGLLSWFASTKPDGLEWSIDKVTGHTGLPERHDAVTEKLKAVQDRTAALPDYSFKEPRATGSGMNAAPRFSEEAGTSVSGIVGSLLVLAAVLGIGIGLRFLRTPRARRRGRSS